MQTETNTAIVVIDMQEDFTRGTLGSEAACKVIPVIQTILRDLMDNGIRREQIIFTRDTHPANYLDTFEGKNLPVVHCIRNTVGWGIVEELKHVADNNCTIIDKPTFGSFALIQTIKPNTDKIILVGVCTDICVISNALILRAAFPETEIVIYENACAGTGTDTKTHDAALIIANSCQIRVKTYDMTGKENILL